MKNLNETTESSLLMSEDNEKFIKNHLQAISIKKKTDIKEGEIMLNNKKKSVNIKQGILMFNIKMAQKKNSYKKDFSNQTESYFNEKQLAETLTLSPTNGKIPKNNFFSIKKKKIDYENFFKNKHASNHSTGFSFKKQSISKYVKLENESPFQNSQINTQSYHEDYKKTFKSIPMPKNANTLYTVLSKKQNEVFGNFQNKITPNFINIHPNENSDLPNNIKIKNKLLTNFPHSKIIDNSPVVFPVAKIDDTVFENESQKRRYEKNYQAFVNLKYLVDHDKNNSDKHISKFLLLNGLKISEINETFKIYSFTKFLIDFPKIDYSQPMTEILNYVFNYIEESKKTLIQNNTEKEVKKMKESNSSKGFTTNSISRKKQKLESQAIKNNMKSLNSKHEPLLNAKDFRYSQNEEMYRTLENEFKSLYNDEAFEKLVNYEICQKDKKPSEVIHRDHHTIDELDKIKKKNKLLEFIMWKRGKNKNLYEMYPSAK